jgi:hypothetical protein
VLPIHKHVISADLDLAVKQFAYYITKVPASSLKKKLTGKFCLNVAF